MSFPFDNCALADAARMEFLDVIYSAALDNSWQDLVRCTSRWFGGVSSVYFRPHGRPTDSPFFASDCDEAYAESYNNHFKDLNPFLPLEAAARKPFTPSHEFIDDQDVARTPFYNEWAKPQDLACGMSLRVGTYDSSDFQLVGLRSARIGRYSLIEAAFWHSLLPHMRRAAEISSRIQSLELQVRAACAAYEKLNAAILVVNQHGHAIYSNNAAEDLLRNQKMLRLVKGRLTTEGQRENQHLRRLVCLATGDGTRMTGRSGGLLSVSAGDGEGIYSLAVSPLPEREVAFGGGPFALVLITSPTDTARIDAVALQSRYGLTQSEAHLAAALCEGRTTSDYAAMRGIGLQTVKWHLKSIFAKTGQHRQVDLVRHLTADPLLRQW